MENTTQSLFNNTLYGTGDHQEKINRKFLHMFQYDTATHGIFFVLGVLGNTIVILMYSFRITRSRDDRYYILALAYVDFLFCIFCSSLIFTKNLHYLNFPSNAACKILMFLTNMFFTLALLVLIVISVHRYRHICLSMTEVLTTKTKHIVIGISAGVSVAFASPKLVYCKVIRISFSDNMTGYVCSSDMTMPGSEVFVSGVTIVFIILSVIGIITMAFLYYRVALIIFKQLRQFKGMRVQKVRFRNLYGNLRASIINAFERENSNLSRRPSSETPVIHSEIPEEKPQQLSEQADSHIPTCTFEETPTCDKGTLRKKTSRNRNKNKTKSLAVYLSTNRKAKRSTLMFIAITIVTVLSYIPTWIFIFLETRDPARWFRMSSWEFHFYLFLRSLGSLGYVTHPWLYAYYDKCFQTEMKKILCRKGAHEVYM
ncbi:uncharacterized protein LOC134235102 [Saccostrea cucullata]|uniref:uncharacterized protein LOC134235102 n=1 Tax=Saccostrea cuccullata TaxID=36930 RepID=UPI002ED3461B